MKRFSGTIRLEYIDGNRWKLLSPIEFKNDIYYFIIPVDFVTDFATVPYFARWFVQPFGNHSYAALLHDYMWIHAKLTKNEINEIFYQNLLYYKVKPWKAWILWLCTCVYGFYYDKIKKQKVTTKQ